MFSEKCSALEDRRFHKLNIELCFTKWEQLLREYGFIDTMYDTFTGKSLILAKRFIATKVVTIKPFGP